MTRRPRRKLLRSAALLALLAGCERGFDDEPLDGGFPLDPVSNDADMERANADDPCRRRERTGWHYSIGHCTEMLAPQRMSGVWMRSFEISDFYPGASAPGDVDESRRDRFSLEIDADRVDALLGRDTKGSDFHFIALTFVGRRTRWPDIDCLRTRHYTIVVDHIERARYLQPAPGELREGSLDPPPPFPPSGEGGVIGRLEAEAIASCEARQRSREQP